MKKLRWSDLSLVSKIVIEVGVLAALMFTINMHRTACISI